jgi:SAM-dependent methyltransferase
MDREKRNWLETHMRCPLCLSPALAFSADRFACEGCGHRYEMTGGKFDFLDPRLRDAEIAETDNISDHPYDGNAKPIIQRCRILGEMVLDCGSGRKSDDYPNVVQLDIVGYPQVDVLSVNQVLPFVDDCFGAVFSLNVLEHVADPFGCARELARVLKPGGVLYVDTPFLTAEHGYPTHYFNMTRMGAVRLFSDRLDLERHYVPASGHPIFMLTHFLSYYAAALPEAERARFDRLTTKEISARDPTSWLRDPIADALPAEAQWVIATTTQALWRKPRTSRATDAAPPSRQQLEYEALAARIRTLEDVLEAHRRSLSWRITRPFRYLRSLLPR